MNRLETILARMKAIQDEHRGKAMPETAGKEFDDLAKEAKALQDQADRDAVVAGVETQAKASRRPASATLPDDNAPAPPVKTETAPAPVGFLRLGHMVAASKGMAEFIAAGMPKQTLQIMKLKSFHEPVIGLNADQLKAVKAVPTIASEVIEPTRLSDLVRVTERDRLSLRDVLDLGRTSSDAVKYIRITNYTRAAAAVANSAEKPQAGLALDSITEIVRTIAVWIPVENQQLADLPQLAGIINTELLWDLDKHTEELCVYGDGIGENFLGIVNTPGVLDARSEAGDTLIDIARRGITDVRRAGYEPNAILMDPLDWENVVLLKGSDQRYVWVVVTEAGVQRLWGVPVIETVAMEDFQGDDVEARHMIVGDFRRGATLWDREDANISVGWVDKQFIKNQRTILAELRAAFGVKRPGAFRKYQTAEAENS